MIEHLINELKQSLSKKSAEELEKIIQQPEVALIIKRSNDEFLLQRSELVNKFLTLDQKYQDEISNATRNKEKSAINLKELEAKVLKAKESDRYNFSVLNGIEMKKMYEQNELKAEIISTADPRLKKIPDTCDTIISAISFSSPVIRLEKKLDPSNWFQEKLTTKTNETNRMEGITEAGKIKQEAIDLMLQALPSTEITKKLNDWINRLNEKMSKLDLLGVVPKMQADGSMKFPSIQEIRDAIDKSNPKL